MQPRSEAGDRMVRVDHKVAARCKPCQLQLCKSRRELPHAALKEIRRDAIGHARVVYACQTCGSYLVCSADMGTPGWSQDRSGAAIPPA